MPKITLQEISGGITIASALPASATNANKIPLLNTQGKLEVDITGDAATVGGKRADGTAGNLLVLDGSGLVPTSKLPISSASKLGAVKIGSNITVAGDGTVSITNTNVTSALGYTPVNKAGDTMGGPLTLSGDPTQAMHAATKQYVDNTAAKKSGDTMTGPLTLNADPSSAMHAATKQYVDNTAVKKSGDTMTGPLTLNGNPTQALHATPKQYVDNTFVKKSGDTMTGPLTLSGDPTQAMHAATKQYVDATRQGLDIKDSVRVATTGHVDLTPVPSRSSLTIDGVTLEAESASEVTPGMYVFVEEGTNHADTGWVLTTDGSITLGTTALNFTQFSGAGSVEAGTGLQRNGTVLSIANTGVSPGTYTKVTVNAQGQVTSGSNPTTLAGYGITDAVEKSSIAKGTGKFSGSSTTPTQITHGLGVTPSVVMITPNENPDGYLGEYWYTADASKIYVYNSGIATTGFAWIAFK